MNIFDYVKPIPRWATFNEWDVVERKLTYHLLYPFEQVYLEALEELMAAAIKPELELLTRPEYGALAGKEPKEIKLAPGLVLGDVQYLQQVSLDTHYSRTDRPITGATLEVSIRFYQYMRRP